VRHAGVPLELAVEVILEKGGGVHVRAPDALLFVVEPLGLVIGGGCRVHGSHSTSTLLEY